MRKALAGIIPDLQMVGDEPEDHAGKPCKPSTRRDFLVNAAVGATAVSLGRKGRADEKSDGREKNGSLTGILNKPGIDPYSDDYRRCVESWDDNTLIWDKLTSRQAKTNFVKYVLKKDETDRRLHQTYGYNPELGKNVDLVFVCEQYSGMMYHKYKVGGMKDVPNSPHKLYHIVESPEKLKMPIRQVGLYYADDADVENHQHAINAVFVGNECEDRRHPDNWVFFEPQDDHIIWPIRDGASVSSIRRHKGNEVIISPDHNNPIYRTGHMPVDPSKFSEDLPMFIVSGQGRLKPVDMILTPNVMGFIGRGEVMGLMSAIRVVDANKVKDRKEKLLSAVRKSGGFGEDEIEALRGYLEVISQAPDEFNNLSNNAGYYVGKFFRDRDFFEEDTSISRREQSGQRKALDFLEKTSGSQTNDGLNQALSRWREKIGR